MADKRARIRQFEDDFLGDNIGASNGIVRSMKRLWVLVTGGIPDDDLRGAAQDEVRYSHGRAERIHSRNLRELERRQKAARKR